MQQENGEGTYSEKAGWLQIKKIRRNDLGSKKFKLALDLTIEKRATIIERRAHPLASNVRLPDVITAHFHIQENIIVGRQ